MKHMAWVNSLPQHSLTVDTAELTGELLLGLETSTFSAGIIVLGIPISTGEGFSGLIAIE